jgi:hypothetical protein
MPRRPEGDRAMTPAERQARRREHFHLMHDALRRIERVTQASEAREIASAVLDTMRLKNTAKP